MDSQTILVPIAIVIDKKLNTGTELDTKNLKLVLNKKLMMMILCVLCVLVLVVVLVPSLTHYVITQRIKWSRYSDKWIK